jgi:hypothetical protein
MLTCRAGVTIASMICSTESARPRAPDSRPSRAMRVEYQRTRTELEHFADRCVLRAGVIPDRREIDFRLGDIHPQRGGGVTAFHERRFGRRENALFGIGSLMLFLCHRPAPAPKSSRPLLPKGLLEHTIRTSA